MPSVKSSLPILLEPSFPRQTIAQMSPLRIVLFIAMASLAFGFVNAESMNERVVARVEMKLTSGDDVVDVIEKGDLLTVAEERDDAYIILTHTGKRGAVAKVNAVKVAESGEIYTDLIQRNPKEGRFYTLRASAW